MRSTSIFVGRHRELEILERKLDATLAGNGCLVVLTGEAGVGKTRVASEFLRCAAARGASTLRGSCVDADWQPAYSPWVDVLGDLVRMRGQEWCRAKLDNSGSPLAQLVPHLLAVHPDANSAQALGPDEERFRLFDAVVRFLQAAAAEVPIVIFLDDLQWAAPDSLRLLRHVSRFLPRFRALIVGAYRYPEAGVDSRHPLADVLAQLQMETDCELVAIRGLGESEVAEYVSSALGGPVPSVVSDSLATETGGNPFYLREILRHMREEGLLPEPGERWPANLALLDLGVPEGVRHVIERRLSRLDESTRQMLGLASGFAGCFAFPVLQELTGFAEEKLLDCLDEALIAGFLASTNGAPPEYQFSHAIVRQAIHSRMNPDRGARLHRRIALALGRAYAGSEMEHAGELASQYHGSMSLPGFGKGAEYALQAVEQARVRRAYEQAAGFLRIARDLSDECRAEEKLSTLTSLAVAEAEALLLDDSRDTVEGVLEAMSEAGTGPTEVAEFLADVARALKEGGAAPSLWEPLVERGLSLVGGRRDLLWARLTLLRDRVEPVPEVPAGFCRWLGHDPEAVRILRAQGDEIDYARTLDSPALPSRRDTDAVLALARSWSRPTAVMAALDIVARDLFYRHGAFLEAADRYRELLESAERYGSVAEQAEAWAQLAVAQAILGDLPAARDAASYARETIERLGIAHGLHFMEMAVEVILAYYLEGDWRALASKADNFVANRSMGRPRHLLAKVGLATEAITAYVHARAGNRFAAERHLISLTRVAELMPPESFAHNSVVTIGAAAVWELGAADFAPSYRKMALDLLASGVGSGPVGPHHLAVARMAALDNDASGAEEHFKRARVQAEAEGLRPSAAIADFDEAVGLLRHTPSARRQIATLLDSAASAFDALEMEGWERRTRELRERTLVPRAADAYSSQYVVEGEGRDLSPEMASLTEREREVLTLLAMGLSNADIAARLVISIRTAEAHVASILGKLGLSSRTQVVVWAVQRGVVPSPDK